ncbi:toxin Cry1Ac domain D-VI-related protein, partial [Listeria booriae]|uniref:toxin Cry1Ac domain D-VI-related protein n=1 Tax=Listeria booriae TaxID=1552123 RepID=UPI001626FDE1
AQDLINKVTDPTIKKDLQKELDKAQDLLAEKVASEKAEKAREEAAKNAVDELFQSNNPSTGIIKETTDQSVIDAAQDLINKVTDPTIKKDLQKELDKAQDLLDIKNGPTSPEFIAAQEAIQDLLTTLVNFGQKTDVYGAVKLDTTQAKVYEAQDKLDLVPDKVVEKAELVAQLKKAQDLLIARNNEQIGNRVVNGNFDNALNGWKTWIGTGSSAPTVVAKDGVVNNAVKLASNSSIEQTIQGLKPNTNYVLTFYGKVDDKTFLSAGIKNHGGTQQSIRVTSADYSKGQIAFTTGANAKSATFFLLKGAGSGNGFADFVIAKADNGEDLIPEVIEATNTVDKLFTNLSVIGVNDSAATLYKNGALKITTKQAEIDAAKAIVDAMKDSYESKADLLATLKTAQDLWDIRSAADTGNLVKNGEFDNGLANWKPWNNATSTTPTTTQENGNNILKLATGSSTEQIITGLQPNTTYTLEVYGKVDNNGYVSVGVKNYGGAQKTARISGADYAKASVTIRTGATNKTATIFMMKGAGTGSGYIDDVRFQDSTPEGERPEVIAATEALAGLFTAQTTVSTTHLTPVLSDNGAIKMTTTDADLAAAAEKVAAVPADLAAKATLDAELARATTLFENLKASQTDNLAKNSQFDNNLTSWKTWKAATASTPVVVTENGNKVLKLEGNSSVEQTITGLLPNTTYTVSAYGKVEEGARLAVGVKSFGGSQTNAYVTSSDYAQGTLTFTTGATNTSAIIFLSQGSANGIAYADLVVAK